MSKGPAERGVPRHSLYKLCGLPASKETSKEKKNQFKNIAVSVEKKEKEEKEKLVSDLAKKNCNFCLDTGTEHRTSRRTYLPSQDRTH